MSRLRRQLHSWRRQAQGTLRALGCLGIGLLAASAHALQGDAKQETTPQAPLTRVVLPTYIEKTSDPHSLKQENGWQVGGINSNLATGGNYGALSLTGGMYFSRTLGQQKLLDSSTPTPDGRYGQDATLAMHQGAGGLTRAFTLSQGSQDTPSSDQLVFQRMNYAVGGLSLSGSYVDVGKDFRGLDALTRQMSSTDAAGAKMMALGFTQSNYAVSYTGIRGLNFASTLNTVENNQVGHQENGITRTTSTTNLGMALGEKHRIDYSISNLTESWDPEKQRTGREVQTQALKFAGSLGQKSKFSLGQTLTATTQGTSQTDVQQRDLSLALNDWKSLGLTGSYMNRLTGQSGEEVTALNLAMNAALSQNITLAGRFIDNTTIKPNGAAPVDNDLLDLKLIAKLTPAMQFSSQFQNSLVSGRGELNVVDHQLSWAVTPKLTLVTRRMDTENDKGEVTSRTEYGVTGKIGSAAVPQSIGLSHRTDTLPNAVRQERIELTYTRTLTTKNGPLTLMLKTGGNNLNMSTTSLDASLLTAQVLGARLGAHTTLSFGYYDGPVNGASTLNYRSWGAKQSGNTEIWNQRDLTRYAETGGELVHQLGQNTKVVVKEYQGTTEGVGDQGTVEYGIEQRVGNVTIMGGRRYTDLAQPDQPEQEESWWRVALPAKQALPAWTANAVRYTVFDDSSAWGIGQAPAWISKPAAGLTLDRRDVTANGRIEDQYTGQYASMLGDRLFVHALFDRNPRSGNNLDRVQRGMLHLSYAVSPTVQIFGRYVDEGRLDAATSQRAQTLGCAGRLSTNSRLQLQMDAIARRTNGAPSAGASYMVEFERSFSDNNIMIVKYRLLPEEFVRPEDRVKLEASYRHAF